MRKASGLVAAGAAAPYFFTATGLRGDEPASKNHRPVLGGIGTGSRGQSILREAAALGNLAAVCDVDRRHAEAASDGGKRKIFEDYRKLLDRSDIEAVVIATPDHWHARIAIDAMKAGKDVYCEKPLTLTIDEGKKLCKVQKATGRVFQVGTQQRTEFNELFLRAVALCHLGRIGKISRVTCAIDPAPIGGPFKKITPPPELNWDLWLGQAPKVDYIPERCHYTFRWWCEYSGGKLTDWGAHHVDIAQWAIGQDHGGPASVEPVSFKFPVPLEKGYPTTDDCYNTATEFLIRCKYPGDVEVVIRHDGENGITFEGDRGRFFVSRDVLTGEPVDDLKKNPIPDDLLRKLRKGKPSSSHMANFLTCVNDRSTPASDVLTHHRALTTCHLANIAMRLGRKLNWDVATEQITGDDEANAWLTRPQRKGYEIET